MLGCPQNCPGCRYCLPAALPEPPDAAVAIVLELDARRECAWLAYAAAKGAKKHARFCAFAALSEAAGAAFALLSDDQVRAYGVHRTSRAA